MSADCSCTNIPLTFSHLLPLARPLGLGNVRVFQSPEGQLTSGRSGRRQASRILIRPRAGFYTVRLYRNSPMIPALIFQICPLVEPQPFAIHGPHHDDWCRPLDRSPRYRAQIDGKPVPVDRVWTARSLRSITHAEYQFRMGTLRQWARLHPQMPEARPHRAVDLAALPPLF
jgi:hypothetical protein